MTDKVIVTNLSALRRKYGANGLKTIRAALKRLAAADKARDVHTRLVALDSVADMKKVGGSAVTDPRSASQNKKAIDAVYTKLLPEYLLILGAVDVVPHQDLKNPVFDDDNDPDRFVYSDLPYACEKKYSRKPEDFIGATRVVGRLPDLTGGSDPQELAGLLDRAATWESAEPEKYEKYLGISAAIWRKSTALNLRTLFGSSGDLMLSPPKGPKWSAAQLRRLTHLINCHGAPADFHFYGERSDGAQPVAHDASRLGTVTAGTVVAAECCYGSELYDPALAGGQAGICSTYLAAGAYGFLGATTIAYGPEDENGDADLVCQDFLRRVLAGSSLGRALLEARQEFAQSAPELDPFSVKTLAQFTLLGDPSIHPVRMRSAGPSHSARLMKKAKAAKTARRQPPTSATAERQERRQQLALKGLTIEATQAAAAGAQTKRRTHGLERSLQTMARRSHLRHTTIRSFNVRRPAIKALGAAPLRRKPKGPRTSAFHVVLGVRSGSQDSAPTPRVIGIVAKEAGGVLVSIREVQRR